MPDTAIIQERIDAIAKAMAAKALLTPDASLSIRSNQDVSVCLAWASKPRSHYADKYEWFKGSPEDALTKAEAWVAALPSPEEARMSAFMTALSEAIELGKKVDVDADLVNPLLALMKKLSKNALQHQPQEAA